MGERIRELRGLLKLNQVEFAAKIKRSRSCVQAWERGSAEPDSASIMMISHEFNVDPDWLRTGEGDSPFIEKSGDDLDWVEEIFAKKGPRAVEIFKRFAALGDEEWELLAKIFAMLPPQQQETDGADERKE